MITELNSIFYYSKEMSLSAKFAKLKGTARPASASNKGRILQNISSQQAKRSVQQNQRRSLNLTSGSQTDKKKKPTLNLIQKSLRKKGILRESISFESVFKY